MQIDTALRWSWSNVLTTKRYLALKEKFGDLDTALAQWSQEFLEALGVREDATLVALNRMDEFDPENYSAELKKRSLKFITCEDPDYPERLKELPDFPVFLYMKGDLDALKEPLISVVGAREMSDYGRRAAGHFVPAFVKAGMVTVSGLAFGVDAEVARETLSSGGRTVAVLGHGLGMIYPKANERLAKEILDKGGLILSEFPLDTSPDKYTFPARNRIIAGLGLGTLVIEAADGSGSLITADLALDYGRDVFAVCGSIFDPNYAGCHQIISRGLAKLVSSPEEVLTELGVVAGATEKKEFNAGSPEEDVIYKALTSLPSPLDDLVVKTKLEAAMINATLTILELKGAAKNVGAGKWVRN
ncbi:DNA protecting protein DprA [Candidatus Peribacteria bacterium RIFCSPLOWO2_01_FULL_51_18]|nr:MAG: DNA protecting protein DprA [Candidatus Peribacteria bacterium RIFCSPHIGHO2_02_FULL_51_15]OGJ66367.1 MAG: DNA protecting protein DprA [Candidatus Peribacteria bacterium RIFCSPLOWO2_01_FULL_51_18]OGJ67832.1 MAG: DNA protecting protein DprA [Candidatus Peribacteria bacterium RIFCSPLOWO2_02_FULL_51_10]